MSWPARPRVATCLHSPPEDGLGQRGLTLGQGRSATLDVELAHGREALARAVVRVLHQQHETVDLFTGPAFVSPGLAAELAYLVSEQVPPSNLLAGLLGQFLETDR